MDLTSSSDADVLLLRLNRREKTRFWVHPDLRPVADMNKMSVGQFEEAQLQLTASYWPEATSGSRSNCVQTVAWREKKMSKVTSCPPSDHGSGSGTQVPFFFKTRQSISILQTIQAYFNFLNVGVAVKEPQKQSCNVDVTSSLSRGLKVKSFETKVRWPIRWKFVHPIDSVLTSRSPNLRCWPRSRTRNKHTAEWPSSGAADPVSRARPVPQFHSAGLDNQTWWKLYRTQGLRSDAARLALFPGQCRGSETHMSDNVLPCEAYHSSGIWQGEKKIHSHTIRFGERAFCMAALADEETAVTVSLYQSVFVCVSALSSVYMQVHVCLSFNILYSCSICTCLPRFGDILCSSAERRARSLFSTGLALLLGRARPHFHSHTHTHTNY